MALQFDFKTLGQPFEVLWPVTVKEPMNGGEVRESEFTARFRVLSEEEIEAEATAAEETRKEAIARAQGVKASEVPADPFARIRIFFVGLAPEHGELDEALFANLMARPFVRVAVFNAYHLCINGVAVKN